MRIAFAAAFLISTAAFAANPIFLANGTMLTSAGGASLSPSVAVVPYDLYMVTAGDSLTRDQGPSNYTYVVANTIKTGQGLNAKVLERGVNGISWNYAWSGDPYTNTMIQDAPANVDGSRNNLLITNWLIGFAGTNGIALNGDSAATEYANFQTWIAARIAAGWVANNIVIVTMLPRTGVTDSIRVSYNALLVSGAVTYGYRLARADQDANIGAAGQNLNTTYFYDGTHLTVLGQSILGGIVYGAML